MREAVSAGYGGVFAFLLPRLAPDSRSRCTIVPAAGLFGVGVWTIDIFLIAPRLGWSWLHGRSNLAKQLVGHLLYGLLLGFWLSGRQGAGIVGSNPPAGPESSLSGFSQATGPRQRRRRLGCVRTPSQQPAGLQGRVEATITRPGEWCGRTLERRGQDWRRDQSSARKRPRRRRSTATIEMPTEPNQMVFHPGIGLDELSPVREVAGGPGTVETGDPAEGRNSKIAQSTHTSRVDSRERAPRKELGAYYTDTTVAQFLVRWAIMTGREVALDPGFGGGVFLVAAAERIAKLGGDPAQQVYGIELDAAAYGAFAAQRVGKRSLAGLQRANFFEVETEGVPAADAVVGNPPFIRYQRFNGDMRGAALRRAREAGVQLSRLTSSWAPFLVHAGQFVKPGGRLAMVAPAELAHAAYARPVLEHLRRSFGTVQILSFSRKIFPRISEDTVLVLAAGRREPFQRLILIDLPGLDALEEYVDPNADLPAGISIDATALSQGRERLLHYLLPDQTRTLYQQLQKSTRVARLGDLADIRIGYVTGANDFFHVDEATVDAYKLPPMLLRPAVRSGADLAGLRFTPDDWETLRRSGQANQLLYLPSRRSLPKSVEEYLSKGVKEGVPTRYKCRVRDPWYKVPHVREADGFLTYMSGSAPKLVANEAAAVAPNTLHLVRLHPLQPYYPSLSVLGLAALWQTSLTSLSCELEGHSLGGGMLKLEPTEAERVAISLPTLEAGEIEELGHDLHALIRRGDDESARERADAAILHRGLGLSRTEIQELRSGWQSLRSRRLSR